MPKHEAQYVQLRIPKPLWKAVGDCADSIFQSKNQFVLQALAQRVRNWTDPLTKENVVTTTTAQAQFQGWMCGHGSHDLQPASECRSKKATHKKGFYNDNYPGVTWAEYCSQEGLTP